MKCTIIPRPMLERMAERAPDARKREIARNSIEIDDEQRGLRAVRQQEAAPIIPRRVTGDEQPDRTIYDAETRRQLPGTERRREGAGPTGDEDVDRAYDWSGITFDFFLKVYDRDSIDGAGLPLDSTVHYGREYANAFWNGSQMVYGDGDGEMFTSLTGPLEVSAHELTHGVTQYTAGFEYEGQSGALNESMSDVFGVLVRQYHLGHSARQATWLIGENLLAPAVQGVALRSMKAPGTAYDDDVIGKDPQPAHMSDFVRTEADNGGVHINSGIPNHAFYLLAVALDEPAWERAGRVWYDTLTGGKLSKHAEFADFAAATIASSEERYGMDGPVARAVRDAWTQVGVPT
ncbi:MAG: peptidase M4 family protein [Streptosporangiales bacterium]|nr:peptidase M4 family protein [Streptosporangiales bacterium]